MSLSKWLKANKLSIQVTQYHDVSCVAIPKSSPHSPVQSYVHFDGNTCKSRLICCNTLLLQTIHKSIWDAIGKVAMVTMSNLRCLYEMYHTYSPGRYTIFCRWRRFVIWFIKSVPACCTSAITIDIYSRGTGAARKRWNEPISIMQKLVIHLNCL